jgi:hypothetical protein
VSPLSCAEGLLGLCATRIERAQSERCSSLGQFPKTLKFRASEGSLKSIWQNPLLLHMRKLRPRLLTEQDGRLWALMSAASSQRALVMLLVIRKDRHSVYHELEHKPCVCRTHSKEARCWPQIHRCPFPGNVVLTDTQGWFRICPAVHRASTFT